jgi:hypothetical protein
MELESLDTMAALQALPESDPVETDGMQFNPVNNTCQSACTILTVNIIQTVCAVLATC